MSEQQTPEMRMISFMPSANPIKHAGFRLLGHQAGHTLLIIMRFTTMACSRVCALALSFLLVALSCGLQSVNKVDSCTRCFIPIVN